MLLYNNNNIYNIIIMLYILDCVDFMALSNSFILQTSCVTFFFFIKVKQENILAFLRAAGLYYLI